MDVGVVGAGIVGLATAYALAERGASVRVYEPGVPGNGQSGGESRVFRHLHDDPRLVAFARESRAIWDEWGERLGCELVSGDGVVALGPAAERRLGVLEELGVPARWIAPDELAARLPVLDDGAGAVLDERGGAIRTRVAIAALTGALGGGIVADEVLAVRPANGRVEVRTGGGRREHGSVVICAGRSTARLAGLEVPVRVSAHVRGTFAVRGEPPPHLACLLDGREGAYGTPLPGNRAFAVGLGDGAPDELGEWAARGARYVARELPGLAPEPRELRHCWVTELPWGPDALAVWQAGPVLAVAGNNLFKHAPALGRALARAALGEPLPDDLRPEAELGGAARTRSTR
jgi:sarcosine oxidase